MNKLKNLMIFCKNIFRKSKLPYLTRYGKPRMTIPDMTPRRMTIDDIGFITDDMIRELSEDYHNAERENDY